MRRIQGQKEQIKTKKGLNIVFIAIFLASLASMILLIIYLIDKLN